MIIVTTNEIPGYRVNAVLGEVMGLTVRSTNIGASFTAGFRAMGGGEITEYTKIMVESRQEVMHRMVTEAQQRGANAIVCMRYDSGSVGQFSEVCAFGTAVVVEPIPGGQPGATPQSAHLAGQSAPPVYGQQPVDAPPYPQG